MSDIISGDVVEYKLSWESIGPTLAYNMEQKLGHGVWKTLSESAWASLPWSSVDNFTDDPWDQYQTLRKWAISHEQPIRNVELAKRPISEFVKFLPPTE